LINLWIDSWIASDRFVKTVIRFAEMVIRIICKNGDQICKNGDQEVPQKSHLQFSVIRFAVFSDQIHFFACLAAFWSFLKLVDTITEEKYATL